MVPRDPKPPAIAPSGAASAQERAATSKIGETTLTHDLAAIRTAVRSAQLERDRHLLICLRGPFVGRTISLGPLPFVLGREQDCGFWLPDSGVSRHHAKVDHIGDRYWITDLRSSNGTFVNGERVLEPKRLGDGDLVQLGGLVALRYQVTDASGEQMLTGLYEASVKDPLTGAYNREYLHERLPAEAAFAARHGTHLSIVMFDLDHFKQVNDRYGHPVGDAVLAQVSAAVRTSIRLEDVLVRYGGEEFLVILRDIELRGAAALAERLRLRLGELRIPAGTGQLSISASFGCASLNCCPQRALSYLVGIADRRLYTAKQLGRNRVVAED